jgi:peptide chain release factor 1
MDLSPLIDRMRATFADIERQMSDPEFYTDRERSQTVGREHQRLLGFLSTYDELESCRSQLADNHELQQSEEDPELLEMVSADIADLEDRIEKLDLKVMTLILPPSPNDSRNTIVEIRPAAGGDEAALFAGDLYRMYSRYAENNKWKVEILDRTESDLGGIKDISFSLVGEDVFRAMRFESGVHRVQRIPTTETGGRIHTSTVTVAVLPEAEEVEIKISPEELRMDVFRSQGPGGQSVNTTDSAVRITHIPSGLSVASQQEKSQHRNREIAMRILRSRLLEMKEEEEAAKHAAERRSQVGTGDRSERIRTYNYPQNRITDHRYNLSWFSLPAIMEGDIQQIFDEIIAVDISNRLNAELQG